jgi:uncharacterized membrane protein
VSIGPVEYVIISFPGSQFSGEIAPELRSLVDGGIVRILDLVFVAKDADGNVTSVEYEDFSDPIFDGAFEALQDLVNDEDIELAGEALEPDSSAVLIIWEDLWAKPLAGKILDAGGQLVAGERIPGRVIEAALEALAED